MDADRYIPFPPSEVIMDFKALRDLPSDPDAMNMEVLLAAAQREIIDLHVQVVQDAKLDPRAIDVEPLAAARALAHPLITGADPNIEADYNDVAAILNIGASGTEISILRGDLLVFTRSVPTGGATMTQAIVDTLGLAWHDAEELKRDMGDALPPHAASTPSTTGASDFGGATATAPSGSEEDWSEFGVGDEDSEAAPADTPLADTALSDVAPADVAPATTDPFDDTFFEQGPQNAEPGEQHQQKEAAGDEAENDDPDAGKLPSREEESETTQDAAQSTRDEDADVLPSMEAPDTTANAAPQSAAPSTSANDAMDKPAPDPAADITALFKFDEIEEPNEELPTADEERPLDFNSLLGEEEDFSDLPTLTSDAAPTAPLPSAFDFPSPSATSETKATPATELDETSDESLPGRAATSAPESIFGGNELDKEETSVLPSESKSAAPDVSTTSPFSFTEDPFAPDAPAPTPAAAAGDFNFDLTTPTEASSTPAPAADPFAAFDLGTAPGAPTSAATSTPGSTEATAPAAESADDFDLDSLFAAAPDVVAPSPASAGAASESAATGAAAFDALGGADVTGGVDFGDDLASFGAGLAGAAPGQIDAQTLYSVIHPVLENLVAEVRRSLEYHTTRYPDAAVRRITLIGGGAKLTNMDAYFTQSLGIPTAVGNPAARLPVHAPKLPPDYVEENGTLYTVAIGLAMRELVR
jgi:Tfp pilus assembly PilM family ATPase